MDVVDQHRVRRHLSAHPARGQGQGPRRARLSASGLHTNDHQTKAGAGFTPRARFDSSLARSAFRARHSEILAVMMMMVVMMTTEVVMVVMMMPANDDNAPAVMMMVVMVRLRDPHTFARGPLRAIGVVLLQHRERIGYRRQQLGVSRRLQSFRSIYRGHAGDGAEQSGNSLVHGFSSALVTAQAPRWRFDAHATQRQGYRRVPGSTQALWRRRRT